MINIVLLLSYREIIIIVTIYQVKCGYDSSDVLHKQSDDATKQVVSWEDMSGKKFSIWSRSTCSASFAFL